MTSALSTWVYIPDEDEVLPAADNEFLFTAGLPDSWQFSRAGTALGRGSDGRWTSYPANGIRPHYDPVTTQNLGVLLEPARTQLIVSPRPLVATAIQCDFPTDTTTQTPFGLGGKKLIPNTTSAFHGFDLFFGNATRAAAIPDGSVVSLQMVFKPIGTFSRGVFLLQTKTGVYQSVEFTTGNGGAILSSSVLKASISPDTDGFFRIEMTVAYGTGTTAGAANFSFRTADGDRTFAGDGTSGIFIAYFGAEFGSECTSPIIPSGGITTRAEDNLSTAAEWLTAGPKAFGIQYTPLSSDPQVIMGTSGADSVEINTSDRSVAYVALAGTKSVGPLVGAAPAPGVERTTVLTAVNNYYLLVQDGSLLAFNQDTPPPNSITGIRLGARAAGGMIGPVIVKRMKFWKRELDRDVLTAFSSDLSTPGVPPVLPVIDIQSTRSVPSSENVVAMTITLTGAPTGATVKYRTVDITAIAGTDYTAANGTIVFDRGDNVATITISLGTRSLLENRAFRIELFTPIDALIGTANCVVTLVKSTPTAHAPLKLTTFNGPLTADWAITRSTPGYVRGSDGLWVSVPANQPRIHYTSATDVGILIEPATSQCLFDSLNFGSVVNATQTVVTNVQTPTGMRLKRWRETAVSGTHQFRGIWDNTAATWPTGDFMLWAIIKPVGARTRFRFNVKGIDGVFKAAYFELSGNGTVVSTTAADVVARIEPEPMATGWYRLGVARPQAVSANVAAEFDIGPVNPADNSTTLTGDTTYGLDICHVQCEAGLFWTSPIPVTAAIAVTPRAADVLKASGTWYSRNSFALGVKFKRLGPVPSSQRIVQFRDVTPAVDDFGILTVDGTIRAPLTTGGTFSGDINGPVNAAGSYSTAVVSIDTTRYSMFVGGALSGEIPMAGKDMPRIVQHVRFGSKEQDGSQAAPIVIQTVGYWTVGLSNDEGIVFSTDLTGTPPGQVEPDPLPIVNIPAAISVNEGQSIAIPVTKIGNGACSVNFRTKAQTAVGDADYTRIGDPNPASPSARIVTFAANESTKLVTFQSAADAVDEPSSEKLGIEISVFNSPPDCQIGNGVGVITIVEAAKPPDATNLYERSKTFASVASDGGIGRPVYRVTSLKDDNTVGTLRYGINLGARHIIFEVGGVIKMSGDWSFTKSDVTISGETAPYPGITIQGTELSGGTIKPQASKRVHFSHINFERCLDNRVQPNTNSDSVDMAPDTGQSMEDIEFRHCSFFWSNDEMISVWPNGSGSTRGVARRISFTDCMFCEPIYEPSSLGYQPHMEKNIIDPPNDHHNYGIIFGVNSLNVDIQYSMLTDAGMRGPFIDTGTSVVVANMIALNSNKGCHITMNSYDPPYRPFKVTCVGYLCISGPDTNASDFAGFKIHPGTLKECPAGSVAWVDGMYKLKGSGATIDPKAPTWDTVQTETTAQKAFVVDITKVARPVDIPGFPVPKLTATDIRARAIKNIGPRPKDRIPNVTRKIKHLENNTGILVHHQSQVGGATNITQTTRALNGSTAYSSTDSTVIPPYPTLSGNVTAADKTAVRDWLEFFLSRLQYD